MGKASPDAATVDSYIAAFPPETSERLQAMRRAIHAAVPGLTEAISYKIPTFKLGKAYLLYIAGWKEHVSLYPIMDATRQAFGEELKPYLASRNTARFPLKTPLPVELIGRLAAQMAEARAAGAA